MKNKKIGRLLFITSTIFLLGFGDGGNEVGGNGDGVSAYFVRCARVLHQAMAQTEMAGTVYVQEFNEQKFAEVLATPVFAISPQNEDILRNDFGEVMDVKVLRNEGSAKILLRGTLWNRYLEEAKPDYRMILHAYLYAAGLDDTTYSYSSRVPLENLGLNQHHVSPTTAEFTLPSWHKAVVGREGIVGVSDDRSKVQYINLHGFLLWEYHHTSSQVKDIGVSTQDGLDVVHMVDEYSHIYKVAAAKAQILNVPCLGGESVIALHGTEVFTNTRSMDINCRHTYKLTEGVTVAAVSTNGDTLGFRSLGSGVEGQFPYVDGFEMEELRGMVTAAFRTEERLFVGGSLKNLDDFREKGRAFIASIDRREYHMNEISWLKWFDQQDAESVIDLKAHGQYLWLIDSDGRLQVYNQSGSFRRDFSIPNESSRSVHILDEDHILLLTDQHVRKMPLEVGLPWTEYLYVAGGSGRGKPDATEFCLKEVRKVYGLKKRRCEAEKGVLALFSEQDFYKSVTCWPDSGYMRCSYNLTASCSSGDAAPVSQSVHQ
jgi:hypothetical protein